MKTVTIVGTGMGPDTVTAEGLRAIESAGVLLGAPRMLADYAYLHKPSAPAYTADRIRGVLSERGEESFAVLVSGDTGFYSAAASLYRELTDCEVRLLPGISSLNYFCARLGRTWQDTALVSCHGREGNLVDTVRRSASTFVLTGGNVPALAAELRRAGFGGLTARVGERLGMDGERILAMPVSQLGGEGFDSLAVLLIENPAPDDRVRFGIPDSEFVRGKVPMTKSEIRAVTMSKLCIRPGDVCWDVGCGTGSVTVEMALAAYKGRVYGVDKNEEAIALTEQNAAAFHLGNVSAVCGGAPDALRDLPAPDAVFVGGSGGKMDEIFRIVLEKNPCARIVVNAIALESVQAAQAAFDAHGMESELVQVAVSNAKAVAGLHMMMAQNPIFVISGGGTHE